MSFPAPVVVGGAELLPLAPRALDDATRRDGLALPGARFAAPSGAGALDAPPAPAADTLALTWLCVTRAELARLDAFFQRVAGRRTAWWCPTWREQLTVGARPFATQLVVVGAGYAAEFPARAARGGGVDALAQVEPSGAWALLLASAAAAPGDGTSVVTASLPTAADPAAPPVPRTGTTATGSRFARAGRVRLADDAVTTTFVTGAVARVEATVVFLPWEA
ncbi:hypothetical protein tb265_39100 [Gemmatimonadetes bacterium T265]|nr:hypothetical protein tb265_39100 [Gemmatimonadetes bacterium T265]